MLTTLSHLRQIRTAELVALRPVAQPLQVKPGFGRARNDGGLVRDDTAARGQIARGSADALVDLARQAFGDVFLSVPDTACCRA
jgi:hypothetical protein